MSTSVVVNMYSMTPQKRPRGLWKRRVPAPRFSAPDSAWFSHSREFTDDDADTSSSPSSQSSSKRRRLTTPPDIEDLTDYSDYARSLTLSSPSSVSEHVVRRPKRSMETTTTARRAAYPQENSATCDLDDWEDLKELSARATEQYESESTSDALPLLRGIIHESHRFLLYYQDPSVIFASPPRNHSLSPEILTPPSERLLRDWGYKSIYRKLPVLENRNNKYHELPTAFHSILGSTLFMFGNIIALDPSLALPDEPAIPSPYWLAALDVFETGENLPSRTNGRSTAPPEDWRMAIVWGRTLVALADQIVSHSMKNASTSNGSPSRPHFNDDPNWPKESPFSAIAARRPPVSRRMSLKSASANELMVLAMDQFSRGIFHMPHPKPANSSTHLHPPPHPFSSTLPTTPAPFSRAKELFTVASEVLGVAEHMDLASERQSWAAWADSVFSQIKMEAEFKSSPMDASRGPVAAARGRCWLVMGTARAEEMEARLERDEMEVLSSEEAVEARKSLGKAIEFFERARGTTGGETEVEVDADTDAEVRPLLTEAVLTLANLTQDENEREALYARAQLEGGGHLDLDSEAESDLMDGSI